MKELKKQKAVIALLAAVGGVVFATAVSAIQAPIPAEMPQRLTPAYHLVTVERPERPFYTEAEEEPEPELEPETTDLGEFKLTAYCTCGKCCGEWADGTTYTGTQATAGRTVAVDPKVIPLGSTVIINGDEYIAEDIGGAIKGNRIDVLLDTHQEALQFGVQYADVTIKK